MYLGCQILSSMSKLIIDAHNLEALDSLDASIADLNRTKLELIFKILGMSLSVEDFGTLATWDLILVSVKDKQMAVQLNKLSAYMPNLKFVVDPDQPLFSMAPGTKPRRVWKER